MWTDDQRGGPCFGDWIPIIFFVAVLFGPPLIIWLFSADGPLT